MSRGGQAAAHAVTAPGRTPDDGPPATGRGGTPRRAALDFLLGRRGLSSAALVGLHQSLLDRRLVARIVAAHRRGAKLGAAVADTGDLRAICRDSRFDWGAGGIDPGSAPAVAGPKPPPGDHAAGGAGRATTGGGGGLAQFPEGRLRPPEELGLAGPELAQLLTAGSRGGVFVVGPVPLRAAGMVIGQRSFLGYGEGPERRYLPVEEVPPGATRLKGWWIYHGAGQIEVGRRYPEDAEANQERLGPGSKALGLRPDPKIARDRMAAARELNHDIECFLERGLSLAAARSETRRVAGEIAWMLGQAYFQAFAIAASALAASPGGRVEPRGPRGVGGRERGGRTRGEPLGGAEREAAFKRQALELERRDGGHSLARHGPEVSPAALERRIRTGVAPDGKVSPTAGSSRFVSHEEWVRTRETAWRAIEETYGVDLQRPPAPGGQTKYVIVVEHNRVIDDGFVGVGSRVRSPGHVGGRSFQVHQQTQAVSGITRTTTRIVWDGAAGRWKVAQHFPHVRGWDQVGQRYSVDHKPDHAIQ